MRVYGCGARCRWTIGLVLLAGALTAGGVTLFRALALGYPPPALRGLPLVEVPASGPGGGRVMAVLLTGDGGWAFTARRIAERLGRQGLPVVGWNSLRYYWSPRTPEGAARDLETIIDFYSARWGRPRVVLVGYSFGADALPFLVDRLSPAARARIVGVTLLGFSPSAGFEFHLPGWIGIQLGEEQPTAPEVRKMVALGVKVRCINGEEEDLQGCTPLRGQRVNVVLVPGGHSFRDRYHQIVQMILTDLHRYLPRRLAAPNSTPGHRPS